MPITLTSADTKQAIASIQRYFGEQLDQEIGDLKASLLLEFFLKELGPSVYNRAIAHAQAYFTDRAADLAGACYEKEFGYWPPARRPRP